MDTVRFLVIARNEILGTSRKEMTLDQIKGYNRVAYRLAVKSAKNNGQEYTEGMWKWLMKRWLPVLNT